MIKICSLVVTPIILFIRTFVQVARQIVETICEWVSTVIKTIKTIVEEICSWLPWPFSKLCELVTKVIEIFETVWNWTCHNVIRTIFDWVEKIVELIAYILHWICIIIHIVISQWIELLICRWSKGRSRKYVNLCIKILADEKGIPCIDTNTAIEKVKAASKIYEHCGLVINICDIEIISKPEYLKNTTCKSDSIFTEFFTWFSKNACSCCNSVTAYFVEEIKTSEDGFANGCAFTGTSFVSLANSATPATVAQEIGHLALLGHSDDPENFMCSGEGKVDGKSVSCNPKRTGITDWQCCVIKSSIFGTYERCKSTIDTDSTKRAVHNHN